MNMKAKSFFVGLMVLCCVLRVDAQDNFTKALDAVVKQLGAQDYEAARKTIASAEKDAVSKEQRDTLSFMSANLDFAQGKFDAAMNAFLNIANDEEASAGIRSQAYTSLGLIYLIQGKYEEERATYKKIFKLRGKEPFDFYIVQAKIADSYSREGKPQLARLELAKVISRRDLDLLTISNVYLDLAQVYLDEKNPNAARESLEQVLGVKEAAAPQDFRAYIRENKQRALLAMAQSYLLEKNYDKAREELQKVLAMKGLTKENREEAEVQIKALDKVTKGATPAQTPPK